MKTAKQKAEELINKYKPFVYPFLGSGYMTGSESESVILVNSVRCALIAVNEIIRFMIDDLEWDEKTNGNIHFWQEVENEINAFID